jgi:hypothetical protein
MTLCCMQEVMRQQERGLKTQNSQIPRGEFLQIPLGAILEAQKGKVMRRQPMTG